jgi:hypothetical protein
MSIPGAEPGHTYTPVTAPDGEIVYLDNIDTKTLTGGISESGLSSNAVNDEFTSDDQGPKKVCNKPPKIPNLKNLVPTGDHSKHAQPKQPAHQLSASQDDQQLLPETGTPNNTPTPPPPTPMPPKQVTIQENYPRAPEGPLEKLDAMLAPAGPQLKAIDKFVDQFSPHYDVTKPGEGVRVIRDSYYYLFFGWLLSKFGPTLGPLLPRILKKAPTNLTVEEEIVWLRTNAKGINVIYREFEEAFYGQGQGKYLKYSDAIQQGVEKLEQYYKIRGLPYPLAPKL